jgi:predicted amidophosphoribosyltransferase
MTQGRRRPDPLVRRHAQAVLDLVLPLHCGGCGAPSTRWCVPCAAALDVKADEPHVVTPRLDPGVPVFALGRYAGPRREAIVALKEHGRRDLVEPLSRALALGIHRLTAWGVLGEPLTVVPAPTRRAAARRRGGDPVARIAAAATAASPHHGVVAALRTGGLVRDSVGLSITARERNIAGRVRLTRPVPRGEILLVDDILTTGATARESVRVLAAAGGQVSAVLALAH